MVVYHVNVNLLFHFPSLFFLFFFIFSWTAAYPLTVNWLYLYFGDTHAIEEHWATLTLYVDGQRREMGTVGVGFNLATCTGCPCHV